VKQVLHIFGKDMRRFWPEILISLAITAAFARIYPILWLPENNTGVGMLGVHNSQFRILANALLILMPVTWWILIARVIHSESMVGDKQFWLTRPYDWPKLLASKLLFGVMSF